MLNASEIIDELEHELADELDEQDDAEWHDESDKRPPPRPRKLGGLWQAYLMWDELMVMRQRHLLRVSAIQRGKSNMDLQMEKDFIKDFGMDTNLNLAKKIMVNHGKATTGPVWAWITGIKGLKAGGEAAKLIAQLDDIGRYATVSKLWRFCGWAVINGASEKNQKGEKSHYNRRLKATCYMIGDQFIRQQTPHYVDIYYAEKIRQRELHPEPITVDGKKRYTDMHIHRRAMRKMIKEFLADLWVNWRRLEGLPTS